MHSKNIAKEMRWHAMNPRLSDGEAWMNFNDTCTDFTEDPRNVRLGLGTHGFSPYAKSGSSYSCGPVILTPYNLPPWLRVHVSLVINSWPQNSKRQLGCLYEAINWGIETVVGNRDAYWQVLLPNHFGSNVLIRRYGLIVIVSVKA